MARKLFYGGNILTMDPNCPRAEAVLVENGKIRSIGELNILLDQAGDCEKIDLAGKTLVPGFVDGHGHLSSTGAYKSRCDLSMCCSLDEIRETILRFRADMDLTHGEPILCQKYDNNLLPGAIHPTAKDLDEMGIDNPVFCGHISGHMCVINSKAIAACGLDDNYTPDPNGDGVAGRDEYGHLNGYFAESAQAPVTSYFAGVTNEQFEQNILLAQEDYISHGFTTIQDGSGFLLDRVNSYAKLAREGKLKADVVIYLSATPSEQDYWQRVIESFGNRVYNGRLKIGGIKIVLDGSPQAKTAWMSKPYEGEAEYCGYPNMPDEKLYGILKAAVQQNLQPLAHCNGDAASEQFLRVWEQVIAEEGHGAELRPVMIHCQTVRLDQLDRMSKCGMIPSIFVGHCWYWGDVHIRNFGERAQRISPARAALDRGLVVNFHQDSPVTEPDMLFSMWCAVNRITKAGVCVGPEQKISAEEALTAVTYGGAYAHFDENIKGRLMPGMNADFVILDRDPTAVEPAQIKEICVLETIKDGKTIYCN